MREIKFRAWLKDKSEMYYQSDNTASCMNGLERFTQIVGNAKGYTLDVMQFTGLLDKNGKEIYEGDIVRCYDTSGEKVYDREVMFFEFRKEIWSEEIDGKTKVEIIGNIYQNPELLT